MRTKIGIRFAIDKRLKSTCDIEILDNGTLLMLHAFANSHQRMGELGEFLFARLPTLAKGVRARSLWLQALAPLPLWKRG